MRCHSCGTENSTDRRFCADCGAPLAVNCPGCGFENQPDARFCGGCGQPLGATAAPAAAPPPISPAPATGERRQVTILFADIAGFTDLSSTLDAEELHDLVSRFFTVADRAIENYGGTVDKHMGDAVMALFGAPVAHGDDPLRAVRAAFDIHGAMEGLSAELGRELRVHVGIASGEVVAGGLGSEQRREYTVLGDSVNLASRLDGLAEAGQTLIAEAVQRAVAQAVDCEALGEVPIKGLDKPVRVWRARGLAGEAQAGARGTLVGRKSELRQFAGVLDACRETGAGQAVALRGEAGIGKTHLVEEFTELARASGYAAHKGLVLDFGVGTGQDAIRSLVRSLMGLAAVGGEMARGQAAEEAVAAGWLKSDQRVFLNDLLDLTQPIDLRGLYDAMDNETRNRGKQDVVAALIVGASGRGPLIVTVEDAHWATALTLSHLARMAATVRDCPAILVITTRIEGDPLDNAWRAETGGAPLMTIDLAPLREAEALELAGGLIEINEQVVRDCIARAEGNPLFLEQLLRNAEESTEEAVPASIQSLVLARMDRLSGPDKAALQAASVIGQRFELDALCHLIENPDYDCRELVVHHLVRPEGGAYLFAHALIREGIYSSLLNSRKRELHGHAAQYYGDEDPLLRAEHLDRAEDPAAPEAYLEAAKAQAAGYRYERALGLIAHGLEIATQSGDKFALTGLKAEMLHDLGSIPESRSAFSESVDLAQDDAQRCRAWIGLAGCMRITDEYDEAYATLEKAEAAADRDLKRELAQIHYIRGNLHFPLGKIDDCRDEHERSLKFARLANSPEAEARALSGVADAEYARGRMITAYDHFRRCIELCREHGFGRIEVANLSMLGFSRYFFDTIQNSREDGIAAVEAARKVGHHRAELLGQVLCVYALVELGELDRAEAHSVEAQALALQLGAMRFEAQNLTWLARIRIAQSRRSEALELLEQALQISRDTGVTFTGPRVLSGTALATQDPEKRRSVLEEGEAVLRSGAISHNYFWFYRDAIEVSLNSGDWESVELYAAALEDYTRPEPLPWCDFFIARGRALAAFGQGRRGAETLAELRRLREQAERRGFMTVLPTLDAALEAA